MTPQLRQITGMTLANYSGRAQDFWEGTRDHDVSQNIAALLDAIEAKAPYSILDFGCGPGRDLMEFQRLGHSPTGLDGSEAFCSMAISNADCPVWHQNFLHLDLPANFFDGIYANASLFHVPTSELPRVLSELHQSLKKQGVLFSSNPRGEDQEGWNGERYGCYHSLESWTRYLTQAGFEPVQHYYRPKGLPRAEQPWLASVWRKT